MSESTCGVVPAIDANLPDAKERGCTKPVGHEVTDPWHENPLAGTWRPSTQEEIAKHNAERAKVRDAEPDPKTPQLKGQVRIELTIEQDINLLAYFQGLNEAGRVRYQTFDIGGEEEWYRPIYFLLPEDDDPPASNPLPWIPGVTWHENVDVTECDLRVHLRTGDTQKVYGYTDTSWSEEDFETLRTHVPWLNQVHLDLEGKTSEEREEVLARQPGPNDTPLEGM